MGGKRQRRNGGARTEPQPSPCFVPSARCCVQCLVRTRHQAPHRAPGTRHAARSDSLKVLLELPPRQPKHARSGIRYRVYAEGDQAMLSFERPGGRSVAGRVSLKYFVGSNTRGRTFLFTIDRFLYQSPINYYARARVWDMPGIESRAPDRTDTRSGFLRSPNFLPVCFSSAATPATIWSRSAHG